MSGKYLLLKVGEETILRADAGASYHIEILRDVREVEGLKNAIPLGGGRMDIAYRQVRLHDFSGDFGKEDRAVTAQLMKELFPEFDIVEGGGFGLEPTKLL